MARENMLPHRAANPVHGVPVQPTQPCRLQDRPPGREALHCRPNSGLAERFEPLAYLFFFAIHNSMPLLAVPRQAKILISSLDLNL